MKTVVDQLARAYTDELTSKRATRFTSTSTIATKAKGGCDPLATDFVNACGSLLLVRRHDNLCADVALADRVLASAEGPQNTVDYGEGPVNRDTVKCSVLRVVSKRLAA